MRNLFFTTCYSSLHLTSFRSHLQVQQELLIDVITITEINTQLTVVTARVSKSETGVKFILVRTLLSGAKKFPAALQDRKLR